MQKSEDNHFKITFSQEFVSKFTKVLIRLYAYDRYMEFLVVPTILNKKTLCYLPLLNYTDRSHDKVKDLLELAKDNAFQIRVLNFDYDRFMKNDTVTMRLHVSGKSSEELFNNNIKSRCKNKIKNSIKKNDFGLKHGNSAQDIEDFYTIFSQTMHKHGTPALDKKLFYYLAEELKDKIIFYNVYESEKVIASMCIIIDKEIAWYPWGGVDQMYSKKLAGYFIYWNVLKDICDTRNVKIFDFGRSSYEGSTYAFKAQFGAEPVKIDLITSHEIDIYSRYSLASTIWKKLPKYIVDLVGPKLCRYLVDL